MSAVALASPRRPRSAPQNRQGRAARERWLLVRYHKHGDVAARDEVAERFLPFARDLALRYSYTDEPVDDLFQVASLGLLKAIDRFDPDRGAKFTSFAAPTILGELKRHFRDKGWALHVPRDLQERTLSVTRATEALSKELGRSPKPREVAQELRCSVEKVLEAQQVASSYEASSLDAPVGPDDDQGASLVELVGGDDLAYELVEERDAIASGWQSLPDMERQVLELRFVHDLTQREIGEQIGYSQMHVSRVLRRALNMLEPAAA
ncbi:MAG TPA: SigB/SigF/SigG family RNA polymerase sigma factor [Thermoleophilaceae bacterium]|nr:SigB/SigF/SigG family RNA polymerase sigma factor [Thermoleophilaceae bacterium]